MLRDAIKSNLEFINVQNFVIYVNNGNENELNVNVSSFNNDTVGYSFAFGHFGPV